MSTAPHAEARRLLGEGFKLCELHPLSKRPVGDGWQLSPVKSIEPTAGGYGMLLAANSLGSIDPDNLEPARAGLRECGFELEHLMNAGVRTTSTRPGSGGRSTFKVPAGLGRVVFRTKKDGTILELRAGQSNLQDCLPGTTYMGKDGGGPYRQDYATEKRMDDARDLPPEFLTWWQRMDTDLDFDNEQKKLFCGPDAILSISKGKKLAFKSEYRHGFNDRHDVPDILIRHGYTCNPRGRWAPHTATGAPCVRPIPGKDGLWQSDHASDPLFGTFDAWTAFVVLDHGGDFAAAESAYAPTHRNDLLKDFDDLMPTADKQRYKLWGSADLAALPPLAWLVRGVLPAVGLAGLYGASGSGKSFLALDMAAAIAEGQRWFGNKTVCTPVVYCALEGEAGLKLRAQAWETRNGRPLPKGMYLVLQPITLTESQDVKDLAAVVPAGAVVIIDTLNRAAPIADENSSKDMGQILQSAKALQALIGGLVVLVHHTGKDTTKGLRGHSSLFAALDAAIEVSRDPLTGREWRVAKSKDGADGDVHGFGLDVVSMGIDDEGEDITSCVIVPTSAPVIYTKPLTPSQRMGLDSLNAALDDDLFGASVHRDVWREAFYSRHGAENQGAKQRAFFRVTTELLDKGLVSEVKGMFSIPDF